MTAVASVGANMHDNNMATSIHGVALPSLQPTLNMRTTPTSIFKTSFEALAKVSTPINDDDADDDDDDEDDDDDDDDYDICNDNSFNTVGNMVAPNRIGSFYDPRHHHSHLSNVTTPNINPHSGITTVGSGLETMTSSMGSIVDEDDDFSDHDSHYSADFEDNDPFLVQFPSLIASLPRRSQSPDVAKQLLDFAETINSDIKKFFGRKPGEEDSCDIYEDKWVSSKSGRELYYADLLRIAHGESIETKSKSSKDSSSPSSYAVTPSTSSEQCHAAFNADNKDKFSGRVNKSLGLGPLNELFEYGLRDFLSINKSRSSAKKFKRLKLDIKKHEDILPMNRRKLPDSFWKQPGCIVSTSGLKSKQTTLSSSNCVDNLINSKTLDFSDLLESWTGEERGDFNGDISCSDVSTTSSE